jgi:hypothetical protein
MPEELASRHIAAWRHGRKGLMQDLSGAVVCAFVLISLLPRLVLTYEQIYNLPPMHSHHSSLWTMVVPFLWQAPPFLIAGVVTGLMFPRRAVASMAFVILAWDLAIIAPQIVNTFLTAQSWHAALMEILIGLRTFLFNGGPYDLIAILGAWVASRWWQPHRGRTTLSAT